MIASLLRSGVMSRGHGADGNHRGKYEHEHTDICFRTYVAYRRLSTGTRMRMPSQPHHREQVRQKIIQSALHLFNRHGFTAASIDDIMAGAGMTRGGFYSYFQSKSELYAETISCFVTEKQEDIASSEKASDRAVTLLRDYLSHQQLDQL